MYEFARHDPHHLHQLAASAHAFSHGLSWMGALFLVCLFALPAVFYRPGPFGARKQGR